MSSSTDLAPVLPDHPTGLFADWDSSAGVRADPRRVFRDELDAGLTLFPRHLVPGLAHPAVAALGPEAESALTAQALYQYLLFTTHLELSVVNRATELLATGRSGLALTPELRLDAARIHTDEAYHALYNLDLVQQVEQATGIAALDYSFDTTLARLDQAAAWYLPGERRLAQLLQVVVFETMVTSILADIPRDTGVCGSVRELVADHADDEKLHHAYFSRLFPQIWQTLSPSLRTKVARYLPHAIHSCVAPDTDQISAALRSVGLDEGVAREVTADLYGAEQVRASVGRTARHTVRLFRKTGVLDEPGAVPVFAALGLVGQDERPCT